jgi:hypothetical protein
MSFRKLRIVCSVAWGIAALLMGVLCVRSYWRLEILEKGIGVQAVQASSVKGLVAIAYLRAYRTGTLYKNVVAGDAADWRKTGTLGFAYHAEGSVTALLVPHWFPASLFITFAAYPLVLQNRQFSLRALLIATTLVAVVLGLIVWLR